MDLAFATTEELVMELIGRTTFVGAIVQSTTEHRGPQTVHSNFQISTNLDDALLSNMLGNSVNRLSTGKFTKIIKDDHQSD
jgi:hypothetical protein